MKNSAPDWVCNLKQGDELIIIFPYTGVTLFAQVIQNDSRQSTVYGILTIKYLYNNVAREEDLLYDDYTKDATYQNGWYAYPVI